MKHQDLIFQVELQNASTTNRYSARKKFVSSTFDISLFVANISQLKTVVDLGKVNDAQFLPYYKLTVILLGMSLIFQLIFALMMIGIWIIERRLEQNCQNHGQVLSYASPSSPTTPTPSGCCGNGTRSKCCRSECAEILDEIGIFIVFFTIMANIVISAFGLTGNVAIEMGHMNTTRVSL